MVNNLTHEEAKVLEILIRSELKNWEGRVYHDGGQEASMAKYRDYYVAQLKNIQKKLEPSLKAPNGEGAAEENQP